MDCADMMRTASRACAPCHRDRMASTGAALRHHEVPPFAALREMWPFGVGEPGAAKGPRPPDSSVPVRIDECLPNPTLLVPPREVAVIAMPRQVWVDADGD